MTSSSPTSAPSITINSILGIDQGTTGTRACLVEAGRITYSAYAPHAQLTPQAGWVEHDPDEIWARTEQVIVEVLAASPAGTRPRGIAIANQGETVMIWDAETRRPLHHALVWQDTRTTDFVAALAADATVAARVRTETGLGLDPYFSAAKLRWLLDHVPGARDLAARGQLRAGTLDTWLIDRLTDGAVFATDVSTAARTQLCDTRSLQWSAFLLEVFGIPRAILAEIRDSDGGFGTCTATAAGGVLAGVPIIASLVDQPAALAGHGCIDRGDAKATLGTGAFVYVNTGDERPSGERGTLATVAWRRAASAGRAASTCYALDGGVLAFGSAIAWLENIGLLARGGLDKVLAHASASTSPASTSPPAGAVPALRASSVVCVPALAGLGAPHWDRNARGSWFGLTHATTSTEMAVAVAEGLSCRVAEVVEAIERDACITIAELRVDGGLSRSPALVQLLANILGRPVVVAEEDEATVLGACTLAELRLGTVSEDEVRTRRSRWRARFEPTLSADSREQLRHRFARAVALTTQL